MKARLILLVLSTLLLGACAERARLPLEAGMGAQPNLPPPVTRLIPTVHIAPAVGWPPGRMPRAARGLAVQAFATGLAHPRSLLALPNGDVLVAETDGPPRPEDQRGFKGFMAQQIMHKAGANRGSPNRIVLLRDADGDGVAESRSVLLTGLNSPFGMGLVGDRLYVANTDAVLSWPFRPGQAHITEPPRVLTRLPAGPINHHWTKDMVASRDGRRLYVSVGSNSNVGENGLENESDRARIVEIDIASGSQRVYASGLRNANGLCWEPETGALWAAVNERDELGSDLVPDYITQVRDGGFYGWPWSYYGAHVDARVRPPRPDMVARAIVPDYAIGAHVAPLGMHFYTGTLLPPHYRGGAFIAEHGSWNRKPRSGYKLVFVPFQHGRPAGLPEDVLDGFVDEDGNAMGRPVAVSVDRTGAVLVSDDVGNAVWRILPAP